MRFATVCSGIGAPEAAWSGWTPVFFSEIEPFPCAVLAHHFPSVPNLGDMTKFHEWPDASFDVLCGGTPCQSFSVAGLRKGLADPRGNLMLTYLAIAARYRPEWLVWENVPGVLSVDDGRAFGALLGGLAELGYGFAYRILDAQFFGVPQRRRRVFVVGHLGDWRAAAAVLFERHSLQGHPAPSRETGKGIAHPVAPSIGASGRGFERAGETRGQDPVIAFAPDISPAMKSRDSKGPSSDGDGDGDGLPLIAHSLRAGGFDASEDGTGRGTPIVFSAKDHGADAGEIAPSLRAGGHDKNHANAGVMPAVAFQEAQTGVREYADAGSLRANGPGHDPVGTRIRDGMQVRRLTPRECERLQGFPDDYTLIPYRCKPAKDGPRYKALGNSMAVPVVRWLGERIQTVSQIAEAAAA